MKEIKILHTNDIHSSFYNFYKIGKIIKKTYDKDTLLLDAGDLIDFSSLDVKLCDGEVCLEMMKYLNYSALAIGNNEGFQQKRVLNKLSNNHFINILSCNLYAKGKRIFQSSMIKEVGGVRFLVVGVSPYYQSYNDYYNLNGTYCIEPYKIIEKEISNNYGKYDYAIILSHLGLKSDIFLCQNINKEFLIIGGHSHHTTDLIRINDSFIHQSGVRGSHIGMIKMVFDDKNKLVNITGTNIPIYDNMEEDLFMKNIMKNYINKCKKEKYKEVASIPINLFSSINYECNFSNLIADYLYNHYSCDFSIVNSGICARNLKMGKISNQELYEVCHSPLRIVSMNIYGKQIIEALRKATCDSICFDQHRRPGYREKYLGKLHVSHNCMIHNSDFKMVLIINNEELVDNKLYKVVTTDYLARGMGYCDLGKNLKYFMYHKNNLIDVIRKALNDEGSYKKINNFRWNVMGENENVR